MRRPRSPQGEHAHQRDAGRPAPRRRPEAARPRRTPARHRLAALLLALAVGYWWALLAVLALPVIVVTAAGAALPARPPRLELVEGAGRRVRRGWRA